MTDTAARTLVNAVVELYEDGTDEDGNPRIKVSVQLLDFIYPDEFEKMCVDALNDSMMRFLSSMLRVAIPALQAAGMLP